MSPDPEFGFGLRLGVMILLVVGMACGDDGITTMGASSDCVDFGQGASKWGVGSLVLVVLAQSMDSMVLMEYSV